MNTANRKLTTGILTQSQRQRFGAQYPDHLVLDVVDSMTKPWNSSSLQVVQAKLQTLVEKITRLQASTSNQAKLAAKLTKLNAMLATLRLLHAWLQHDEKNIHSSNRKDAVQHSHPYSTGPCDTC
jgi:hypothetical protein